MPDTLIIERPKSGAWDKLRIGVMVALVMWPFFAWRSGTMFSIPGLSQRGTRIALVAAGIVVGILASLEPTRNRTSVERVIGVQRNWRTLRSSWWMMLPVFAPLVVVVAVVLQQLQVWSNEPASDSD